MTAQLPVKPGDRVKIVIPKENIEYGAGRKYPQGGTGTIKVWEDKKQVLEQKKRLDYEKLALVVLDKPFLLEEAEGEKPKKVKELHVPTWLLQYE